MDEVVEAAQELLKRRTGAAVRLVDATDLGGGGDTVVLRVRVAENPFSLPRTLVLKQVLGGNRQLADGQIDESFRREAVSYQFCNSLSAAHRPGPELVAYDLDARLLVLSDLGDAPAMGELLARRDTSEVTHSLMALAQSLGRMHSSTYGREEDYTTLLHRTAGVDEAHPLNAQAARAVDEVPSMLQDILAVAVPEDVRATAASGRELFDGGRFRAFSTADLCPDNILVNEGGVKFLDYEWGGFRDATLDISYALASFPTCLCALELSQDQVEEMVEAWRAEVVSVFPQLRDDSVLYSRLLAAMLVWLWLSTWLFLDPSGPDMHVDEDAESWLRQHELAVGRRPALRRRWAILAAFADNLGDAAVGDHARAVLGALEE
ncbi:kinase [Tomitella fengzijianii]|uniref:kinase n=1 Tax=Tomitella fengzijianii TaxID=2597660 RepID=UPI00143DD467|nr:kinase [Tomitella fengzijianii]